MSEQLRWSVIFGAGKMNLGGFSANMQYGAPTVTAATRDEAIEVAKVERDKRGFDNYTRVVSVQRIYRYTFTFTGERDARKRETFITHGTSEDDAKRHLRYMPAVNRFAGYGSKMLARIVKVEVGS